jgi:hypothetical protein
MEEPAPSAAYEAKDRQYVVITSAGNKLGKQSEYGDACVAFALPKRDGKCNLEWKREGESRRCAGWLAICPVISQITCCSSFLTSSLINSVVRCLAR